MTTAQVTLETGLGMKHTGAAGIVFQPLETADFDADRQGDRGAAARSAAGHRHGAGDRRDEFGYRWLIFRDPDFEDLVVALNTISTAARRRGGYGDRCWPPSSRSRTTGKHVYFIYNFKRGGYYPFVPAPGDKERDTERELRLKAQVGAELPFEEDISRWFPLWEIPL